MFFQQARQGNNHWLMYIVLTLCTIAATVVGQMPLGLLFFIKVRQGSLEPDALEKFSKTMNFATLGVSQNVGLLLMLLPFVLGFFTFRILFPLFHARPFLSVITTSMPKLDWQKVGFSFAVWFGLVALAEFLGYLYAPSNYTFVFEPQKFIILLIISILFIPLQTSLEEVIFRGYFMQAIGLATRSRLVAWLFTSVMFGALHFSNPEVGKFGMVNMMIYYISMGLMLGILTLINDGLEFSLGVHAANNIFGAVVVSFEGSALQTPALFRVAHINIGIMLLATVVLSAILCFILIKKYHLNDWSRLYKPIVF